MVSLSHYLVLGAILFAISIVGIFLNRKNVIILLMAIELMLLAVNMNFVAFSHYLQDVSGQIFVFFILTVAAAESAIGLAILVVLFRNLRTINVDDLDNLKGYVAGAVPRVTRLMVQKKKSRNFMTEMQKLYLLVPLAPLAGALIAGLFGRLIGPAWSHRATIALMLVCVAASIIVFMDVLKGQYL